jgi:predicted amidohydrolase
MKLKIAAAQYDISFLEDWQAYRIKIISWVDAAKAQGVNLLVFPEYFSMELASLFGKEVYSSLSLQLISLQTLHKDFFEFFQELARHNQCYIQAGTFPVAIETGVYINRAYLFYPDGTVDFQDKLVMTRFEKEQWLISPGDDLKVFETEFGIIAINICYDSEFPLIARKQVEMGANLILVPSCTDTIAGFHRVKIGCQARALENQCYVAQACLVGNAEWSEAVDVNIGVGGIYTPVDRGFPQDGILISGEMNAVQWVIGELDLSACTKVREQGQVLNYQDWPLQFRPNPVN